MKPDLGRAREELPYERLLEKRLNEGAFDREEEEWWEEWWEEWRREEERRGGEEEREDGGEGFQKPMLESGLRLRDVCSTCGRLRCAENG